MVPCHPKTQHHVLQVLSRPELCSHGICLYAPAAFKWSCLRRIAAKGVGHTEGLTCSSENLVSMLGWGYWHICYLCCCHKDGQEDKVPLLGVAMSLFLLMLFLFSVACRCFWSHCTNWCFSSWVHGCWKEAHQQTLLCHPQSSGTCGFYINVLLKAGERGALTHVVKSHQRIYSFCFGLSCLLLVITKVPHQWRFVTAMEMEPPYTPTMHMCNKMKNCSKKIWQEKHPGVYNMVLSLQNGETNCALIFVLISRCLGTDFSFFGFLKNIAIPTERYLPIFVLNR